MPEFAITWDYRCPFARNAHEYVLDAVEGGAPWDVRFVPFSLGQVHVEEGQPDIWERPDDDSGLLALQAGVAVRDRHPEQFHAVHRALFAARHDNGGDLRDRSVIEAALSEQGVDPKAVFAEIDAGWPLEVIRKEHEEVARDAHVWGVPTFITGDRAVFARLMDRPGGDSDKARRTVERVVELMDEFPELNEFKHTSIPR
jgi:protein-disulfide isomerase